jgi:hypothetical protein
MFAAVSHDSRELKIADFTVTQTPAQTGSPHLLPGNKSSNVDYRIAVFRRVADDIRCRQLVTRIMHDVGNVGMLCHAQVK